MLFWFLLLFWFLVSSALLMSFVFFPPGASLFISLLICRNLAYNILQISHIFCPLATCLLSCLFCESLTRNLYFLVAKMIIFCFIFVFLVFFLKISFQDLAAKIFYDFFSINFTILPLSFRSLVDLETTLAYDVM